MTNTSTTTHTDTVAAIYEAYGRGDVQAILDRLAPDVRFDDWPANFAQLAGAPHLARRTGRAEVAEFFALVSTWQVELFELRDLLASGTQVVADVRAGFRLPGGGRFIDEELHLWTFGSDGLVTRLRHYVDTAKHIAAAAGTDTTAG